MLNEKGVRELAYVVKVGWVRPIEGADNIELIGINGWTCIAKKGEFAEGDLAVYFEIDSKLPEAEWSAFMESKHYKVKTMKLNKFKVVSQGLALPASAFGWTNVSGEDVISVAEPLISKGDGTYFAEGDFLTQELGVTYAAEEDNVRKGSSSDKYKKMASRHPKVFKNPVIKWVYGKNWGKKLLFVFFGKKKDGRNWPAWVVKTDEERVQNMPWILTDKSDWIATEKIDGTSTTATLKRKSFGRYDFYICSRNVVFDKPDKKCFYETNVYTEMAEKYNFEEVLKDIADYYNLEWVTLQGETYGEGVQKRDYGLKGHDFMGFNLIFSDRGRLSSSESAEIMKKYGIPWVPILNEHFVLPDTVEELLAYATDKSLVDGGMREGVVFRSPDGSRSFKAVSNEFLLKYHNG